MIRIDDEIKNKFYADSIHKELVIEFVDTREYVNIEKVNCFENGNAQYSSTIVVDKSTTQDPIVGFSNFYHDDFEFYKPFKPIIDNTEYLYISFDITFSISSSSVVPETLGFDFYYTTGEYSIGKQVTITKSEIYASSAEQKPITIYAIGPAGWKLMSVEAFAGDLFGVHEDCNLLYSLNHGTFIYSNSRDPKEWVRYSDISLEKAIKYFEQSGDVPEKITNKDLIAESMKMTESLCSSDNLKLGACESSVFEITVANRLDNFKNKIIKPSFQLETPNPDAIKGINFYTGTYPEPGSIDGYRGYWDNRTFNSIFYTTGIDLDNLAVSYTVPNQYICFRADFEIFQCTLSGIDDLYITVMPRGIWHDKDNPATKYYNYMTYSGNMVQTKKYNTVYKLSECVNVTHRICCYLPLVLVETTATKVLDTLDRLSFKITDSEANYATEGITGNVRVKYNDIQITIVDELGEIPPDYNTDDCIVYKQQQGGKTIEEYLFEKNHFEIPLGKYVVQETKVEHVRDISKKTLTCYDSMYKLSENAANWYTSYMYALSTTDYTLRWDFEYVRQIYSTYFNIAKQLGLEKIHDEDEILAKVITSNSPTMPFYKNYKHNEDGSIIRKLVYNGETFDVNPSSLYRAGNVVYASGSTVEHIKQEMFQDYGLYEDELFRGLFDNASVLVTEYDSASIQIRKYVVDVNDYFALSENCAKIRVAYPMCYRFSTGVTTRFGDSITIYECPKPISLKNKSKRLLYYKYFNPTKADIFSVDSSITARDVIRSILELTGCFYTLDRNGDPEFIYCTKTSLYPSETLYPADNLFPRGAANESTLPMSRYRSFECQEYTVQDIGKIQILKNTNTNEGSICEWEYVGNPAKQNTYIIDDNIFLCNENMMYEPDSMPELSSILEEMYTAISNMSYTPNTTICIGMPWIEVGDRIMLLTKTGGAESFIFRRTLTGIQALKDTYESTGDEIVEAINKYDY